MEQNQSKGMAIASMVIGIISLLLSCCYGGALGVISIILGIIVLINRKPGKGMAIAGVVTSALAIIVTIVSLVVGISALNEVSKEISDLTEETTEEETTEDTTTEETTEVTTETATEQTTEAQASTEEPKAPSSSDIEIIKEYVYERQLYPNDGYYTYHFYVIRNNSDKLVTLLSNEQAVLKDGSKEDAVGVTEAMLPGEERLFNNIYEDVRLENVESFEAEEGSDGLFQLYQEDTKIPMTPDLKVNYEVRGQDVTFTVTNNSQYEGYIYVYILFLKDDKVVGFADAMAVDTDNSANDYCVPPGKTSSERDETCVEPFDDVLVFCNGESK